VRIPRLQAPFGCVAVACTVLLTTSVDAQERRHPGFVDAAEVVDGLLVDMRYFGSDNFIGTRVNGYEAPRCLLTLQAAKALAAVQHDLSARGLGVKVFDCYRPLRAVAHFVRWTRNIADVKRKAEFYPEVDKRNLFPLGYVSMQSGHARGSTVDVTLVTRTEGAELDMGTPFDFFSPRSHADAPGITTAQRANRRLLADAMRRRGFLSYRKEWWHFVLRNEPFPATSFDFPVH
jgi:D-alanyl-D-alanine dipeptidase